MSKKDGGDGLNALSPSDLLKMPPTLDGRSTGCLTDTERCRLLRILVTMLAYVLRVDVEIRI